MEGQKLTQTTWKQISEWSSIKEKPPINEIETLRILDQLNNSDLSQQDSNDIKSKLYAMIAYYRLKRNKQDNKITESIISEIEKTGKNLSLAVDLSKVKTFTNFYSYWKNILTEDWSLRETDFEQVKLKKITVLEEELLSLYQTGKSIESSHDEERCQLEVLFHESLRYIADFLELLNESSKAIRNKRTSIPVSELNQSARVLTEKRRAFSDALPEDNRDNDNENPLEKLNNMTGLKEVKSYIKEYYHYLKYQQERKKLGFSVADEPGLHMIFSGNPGTGKTTIARLLAEIYFELGLLDTKRVTEVNRSHLVGSYIGQSEENTLNYVRESVGGILFIDEAYSLKREGQTGNDYGQAVIDTLVSSMTSKEYESKFAVILAGYPEEMRQFLWSNPGLRSRIPEQNKIELPDFETGELLEIAENTALDNDYFFTEEALTEFKSLIEKERVDESFGNARTVRDLVLKIIFNKGASKSDDYEGSWLDHMRISREDLSKKEKSEKQPMKDLENLIGLDNVKQEVKKLSAFVRIQQVRKKEKHNPVPIQLHAVFSGNPGTGKTTVAKIYSKILNDCGLLKRGHLVVASRSDLVAGYVGQTAIKTKQKVREALGGVLFIDEAYSLYRGDEDFGKEAIDTLVDEITKHNENLVIILAGYENEMRNFIESNPGLQSRFKKYFHFADYGAEELIAITRYQTLLYDYEAEERGLEYLREQFSKFSIAGNARFVTNLIDEAIQFQAWRLMGKKQDFSEDELKVIEREDFEQAWNLIRGKNN